eukprot:1810691-Rhodomonas_salina.3
MHAFVLKLQGSESARMFKLGTFRLSTGAPTRVPGYAGNPRNSYPGTRVADLMQKRLVKQKRTAAPRRARVAAR